MTSLDPGIADYTAISQLGSGGFGTVYRAWQPEFEREVAIKVVTDPMDPTSRERFEQECTAMGALSGHPNVVTVYELATGADGRPCVVMELLSGGSLADLLDEQGALGWERVLSVGIRLAGALESAHRAGVLHRDVKPENVLFSRFGEPKLADFGLAASRPEACPAATVAHAAPEVLAGGRPMPASDVYSLASTMFTLLAGHAPFVGPGDTGLVPLFVRIADEPPPDLRTHAVPDQLCGVLEQALAKDPGDRQDGAARFGRQLQAIEAALGVPITPMLVESEDPQPEPVRPPDAGSRGRGARTRRPWWWWSRLAGGALMVVGLVSLLIPSSGPRPARLAQVYEDDFAAPQETAWYERDDGLFSLAYDHDHYRITVKQAHQQVTSDTALHGGNYGQLTGLRDVSIAARVKPVSGSGLFGLTCRQSVGATAYYQGLVGADGTARIVRRVGSRFTTLGRTWVPLPPLDRFSTVRLDCLGGPGATRIRLFSGDSPVVEAVDHHGLPAGRTGLVLASADAPGADVLFDDVVIFGQPASP